jgi:signal transduction histidine kinase
MRLRLLAAWLLLPGLLSLTVVPWALSGPTGRRPPAPQLEILEDPTRQLDVAAVLTRSATHWQPQRQDVLRFGFSNSAWWVRLNLRGDTAQSQDLVLELASPRQDFLDFYLIRAGQVIASHVTGDQRPFASRPLDFHNFAFPIELPAGEFRQVLLRLDTRDGVYAPQPLRLWEVNAFFAISQRAGLLWGGYYGAILALLVYYLLLFASTRDRNFLFYSLYLGGFALWSFGFLGGYGYQFLWPDQPGWNNQFDILIPALVYITATLFVTRYLDTRQRTPVLHRLLWGLTAVLQIAPLLMMGQTGAPGWTPAIVRATDFFIVISSLLVLLYLGAGLVALRRGFTPARYFVLAWSFLILGGLIQQLARLPGVIPINALTANSIAVGSTLEFLLLALALGDRFNRLKDENLAMERRAREVHAAHAATLEIKVQERTRELHAAMDQVKVALDQERRAQAEQQAFLATLSHELRTPLTVIDTVAQNLELDAVDADQQTQGRYAKILQATARLSGLLDGYLDQERFSLLRHGVKPVLCDPRALLADAVEAARLLSNRHRLRVEVLDLPEFILCEPRLTRLALRNLADNAVKYTPSGTEVIVRGRRAGRRVDDGVWLEVVDLGPGIPAAEVDRLFDPQVRAPNPGRTGGSGMGLSLARRMIQTQGGTLTAISAPGHGSCFRIWLPEAQRPV